MLSLVYFFNLFLLYLITPGGAVDTQIKGERKQVIDVVKNQNRPRSEHQEKFSAISKSKYSLITNIENLNEKQKLKLMAVKKVCPSLATMHKLK
jgi:transposase